MIPSLANLDSLALRPHTSMPSMPTMPTGMLDDDGAVVTQSLDLTGEGLPADEYATMKTQEEELGAGDNYIEDARRQADKLIAHWQEIDKDYGHDKGEVYRKISELVMREINYIYRDDSLVLKRILNGGDQEELETQIDDERRSETTDEVAMVNFYTFEYLREALVKRSNQHELDTRGKRSLARLINDLIIARRSVFQAWLASELNWRTEQLEKDSIRSKLLSQAVGFRSAQNNSGGGSSSTDAQRP